MIDVPVSDLISKDLRRWFKEKWVDVSRKDKDGKHPPCGRSEAKTDSKGYPKCRPSKKVSSKTPETTRGISSKEKKAMTRRKRSKPQGVGGKPTMVKSMDADPRDDLLRRKLLELMVNRSKEAHERTGDGSSWDSYIAKVLMATPSELLTILEAFERHPYEELRAMAAPIRQEYDALSQDYVDMIHDDDGDFTASADPFEAAWDSIIKDFYFDNSAKGETTGGEFIGPSAKGITQVADAKGRKTGIKGLFSNRQRDIEAEEEDGNPSSQNTRITGDALNDFKRLRRFDTKPYSPSERKERGEGETPNDPQNPSNFRRGGSLPRTTKVSTDTPYYDAERFIDMEGNPMDPKGEKEGWGAWDRTGKRQFRSDVNKPTKFEGQKRDYNTHVGANLTSYGNLMREGKASEDDTIRSLASTLGHEYTHSSIDEELKDAVNRGDLPAEHFASAHEIGAHVGQYADLDDEQMEENVNRDLSQHPNTNWLNLYGKTPEKFQGMDNQIKMPKMGQSSDDIKQASFDQAWGSIAKGRFHGYTQSNISNRPYRQAEHRVWDISRKVKRERTKKRYARNKSRGTVRPAMRRQLGAGGKRASTKR